MSEGEPKRWDNEYYGGAVRSMKTMIDDRRATQGEIDPGDYEFTSEAEERITVTGGTMEVMLPGETAFRSYGVGEVVVVPPNSSFTIRVTGGVAAYDCVYMDPQFPVARTSGVPDEFEEWDEDDDYRPDNDPSRSE